MCADTWMRSEIEPHKRLREGCPQERDRQAQGKCTALSETKQACLRTGRDDRVADMGHLTEHGHCWCK